MTKGELFKIWLFIIKSDKVTEKQLAVIFGTSPRSISRAIDELIIAGVPINIKEGRNGGVYVDSDYKSQIKKIIE